MSEVGKAVIDIQWLEATDGARHPTMHRTHTHTKKYWAPNVSSSQVENPGLQRAP